MTPDNSARVAALLAALGYGEGCTYAVNCTVSAPRELPWALRYSDAKGSIIEDILPRGCSYYATEAEAHSDAVAVLEGSVDAELRAKRKWEREARCQAETYRAEADALEAVLRGAP